MSNRGVRGPAVALGGSTGAATAQRRRELGRGNSGPPAGAGDQTDDEWMRAILAPHLQDLAELGEDETEGDPMASKLNVIQEETARLRAKSERIPVELARHRVAFDAQRAMNAARVSTSRQPAPAPSGAPAPAANMVPPIPTGEVTLASARLHLQEHMPGFDTLNADEQFHAAKVLRSLAGPNAAQLSRRSGNARPTVVLALYPGTNTLSRARSFLAATVDNWAELPTDTQWSSIKALKETHALVDLTEVSQ